MKCILLHGLGQTSSSWEKTIQVLDEKLDIDCPDLFTLLHGKEINYANLYQAFSEYCETYAEPFYLCGLSLGGILALQYGIENTDKVDSMALIATQYVMPKTLLKLQNAIFRILPNRAFKKMGLKKKDVINLSGSMMNLNFQQSLHKIKCPVLVVCGKRDQSNMRASLQLTERLCSAKFIAIEHAGHEVNVDAPESLGEVINDFFSSINTPQRRRP